MIFRINVFDSTRITASLSVLALTIGLTACGGQQTTTTGASPGATDTAAAPRELDLGGNVSLTGAGASFPAPLYQRWFIDLNKRYPNLQVNYQSTGSGAGIEQFTAGTVDFAASDVAMTDEEIQKVQRGVLLLPMTAGAIVLAYNLPNVEDGLRLPRQVYSNILLGNITNWNDPQIAAANPGVNLPNTPITVVHRSDGSGTTGVFTMHLSAISPEWKSKVGEGRTVDWPVGLGAKGNEGVTAQVQQTQGAIGYVEYGYAEQNNLTVAALENQSGNFIEPSEESATNALAAVELPENLRAFIEDPAGENSYPVVTYTWLLAYRQYPEAPKARAMEAMIEYGLTEGQRNSAELGYVPLPQNVVQKVAEAADQISPDYQINVSGSTASN